MSFTAGLYLAGQDASGIPGQHQARDDRVSASLKKHGEPVPLPITEEIVEIPD